MKPKFFPFRVHTLLSFVVDDIICLWLFDKPDGNEKQILPPSSQILGVTNLMNANLF
jgi:hypothetical protein